MGTNSVLSQHEISRITKMLMVLFKRWDLSVNDQLSLLGMAKNNRSLLYRYRKGTPLANDRDKIERAVILLNIYSSLRTLFPNNRNLAYSWMTISNRAFKAYSPVKLIDEQGMMGLYIVQTYLSRQIFQ